MSVTEISIAELKTKIDAIEPSRLLLLEALPERHYTSGHLPGARHLPHDQARALAEIVAPDKRAEIVVYCSNRACANSHIAAGVLAGLGYDNVRVFAAGKQAWQEAGFALEGGQ